MTNDKSQPTYTYSEYVDHNGMNLEIRGEKYDEPFKASDNVKLHVKVSIIDTDTKSQIIIHQFEEIPNSDLILEVKNIKNNIEKFVPINH